MIFPLLKIESPFCASSIISLNLSCAVSITASISLSPVLSPYGSLNPLPTICSLKIFELAVLNGTIVYKLLTSHPSFNILTWITISTGLSGFSTCSSSLVFSSVSEPDIFDSILIVLFLYLPFSKSSDLIYSSTFLAWSVSLHTININGLTKGLLLILA